MRTGLVAILSLVVCAGCVIEDEPVEWLSPRHPPYSGAVVPLPTDQPPEVVEAFRRFNEVRVRAGLKPVEFDARMSDDLNLHLRYLLLNHGSPATTGLLAHREDPSLPGYTPEGERAGHKSILASASVELAVDVFLNTFYHRIPILSPALTRIGVGWGTLDGRNRSGFMLEYGGDSQPYPMAYPQDGQEDLPLTFMGETPDPVPIGAGSASFPVTLTFGEHVTDVVAVLYDEDGGEVPVHLSTPEKPAIDHPQKNTVCLLAKTPFMPGRRYTVEVSVTRPDATRTHWRWSFKTAVPIEMNSNDEAALAQAVGKLVRVTGPVGRAIHTTSRGWYLGSSGSSSFIVWVREQSWRSFTEAGLASHEFMTGTSVSVVGQLRKQDYGYSLSLIHHSHLASVEQVPVVIDAPTFDDLIAASGRLALLKTAGVYPRDPSNGTLRMRLATADGTFLSAYIAQAALDGHPGLSLEALAARSMSITGVLSPEGESGNSYLIYVDRAAQWSFPDDEPDAIDADEPHAVVNARGRLVRSKGTVRNPKEADHLYFAFGSNSGGTSTTFVQVSAAAWQSLRSQGINKFEDLNGRGVEVLGVPLKMTTTTNIYAERGDQITLLP